MVSKLQTLDGGSGQLHILATSSGGKGPLAAKADLKT
jgi:hypothetical protein